MLCSNTDELNKFRVTMTAEEAKLFSEMVHGVRELGGDGRVTFVLSGGNITSTEITVKKSHQQFKGTHKKTA